MLRFSIVIPNLNSGALLERAIRSLLDQKYENLQLILADGGSDDESRRVIDQHAALFQPLISRRDDGQADALNYAFRQADGEIHSWLCADDELLPGTLSAVAEAFEANPGVDVVAGACERLFGARTRQYVPVPRDAWRQMRARNVFDQPSVFWRAPLHRKIGELDTTFRLAFDWEFWCRMGRAGAKLYVTERVLSRYHFSDHNKTSTGGSLHVVEGYRVVSRYGPYKGALAAAYRFLYRHFDLRGCLDDPPSATPLRRNAYRLTKLAMTVTLGARWMRLYGWHFASLQERGMLWWDTSKPQPAGLPQPTTIPGYVPDWTGGTAPSPSDPNWSASLDRLDLVLNRNRLASFTREFGGDADVRDLLLLEALLAALQLRDRAQSELNPVRLWETVWTFKALGLRSGNRRLIDAGSETSLLSVLAALAGNQVLRLTRTEQEKEHTGAVAAALHLGNLRASRIDDPTGAGPDSFDRGVSLSALEHLPVPEQQELIRVLANTLKQGAIAGLTFDYGLPGKPSIQLPAPHEPPADSTAVESRYVAHGLRRCVVSPLEPPQAGALYHSAQAPFTVAALFLAKGVVARPTIPLPDQDSTLLAKLTIPNLAERILQASKLAQANRSREDWELQTALSETIAVRKAAEERLAMIIRLNEDLRQLRNAAGRHSDTIQHLSDTLARRDAEIARLRKDR